MSDNMFSRQAKALRDKADAATSAEPDIFKRFSKGAMRNVCENWCSYLERLHGFKRDEGREQLPDIVSVTVAVEYGRYDAYRSLLENVL